jgi:hypothetical protein
VVKNVAPTITSPLEGDDVTSTGFTNIRLSYNDDGFDNLANPSARVLPGITDPQRESFTYVVDWGDGSVEAIHTYAAPGTYTVLVTPPGASTPLSFTFVVTDISTPPVLTLVGEQLSLNDPGAGQAFTYLVSWGDDASGDRDSEMAITLMLKDPSGLPFISTRTVVAESTRPSGNIGVLTEGSFDIQHRYLGPPNPGNPTADIPIEVTVVDDNLDFVVDEVAVGNPGITVINVRIDTTPDVPRLEYVPPPLAQVIVDQQTTSVPGFQSTVTRVVGVESKITSQRFLELVVVAPDGREVERHVLKDDAILNLRALFATLPDNHYRIYLVRSENNSRRLVIDVYVRGGRVIDPSDDSEGTRDRPPMSETPEQTNPVPVDQNPFLDENANPANQGAAVRPEATDGTPVIGSSFKTVRGGQAQFAPKTAHDHRGDGARPVPVPNVSRWAAQLAGLGLVVRGSWSKQVEAAMKEADDRDWLRLRRAGRLGKASRRQGRKRSAVQVDSK